MPNFRWTISDGTSTYRFDVNPSQGGSPTRRRNITQTKTCAADGKTLMYQGRLEVPDTSVTGTLQVEAQIVAFNTWARAQTVLELVDDLGRTSTIVITEFAPKSEPRRNHAWRHTYTMKYLILTTITA